MKEIDYLKRYRRLLVDMHIPDRDPKLLSLYDPEKAVALWKKAGVNAAMFYCQSSVGLSYWPTRVGKMHRNLKGRDLVGETLKLLHASDIAACGYYSVIFNNLAFLEHPEWRMEPAHQGGKEKNGENWTGTRFGLCCLNHPDYRKFCTAQIEELLGNYKFDAFFFDMTFWPGVCLCTQCRQKFLRETGKKIPEIVDWLDTDWCAFMAARDRWLEEFAGILTEKAKSLLPGIPVYHNFASVIGDFLNGLPLSASAHNDFLAGDFYGSPSQELLACKLFQNLSTKRPIEFMTSRCTTINDHERTKSLEEMRASMFASFTESGAMLFIDAVDPEGTLREELYDRLHILYDEASLYEPWMGGEPVEDIGIYLNGESRMDFRTNGTPIQEVKGEMPPHLRAVEGFCGILSRAHLPFGIITRKQLPGLDRYRLLILPNVLRMDREETEALRRYVKNGGKLIATRYTSLTETEGRSNDDFMLADLFGCHYGGDDLGQNTYLKFTDSTLKKCINPQRYLSHCVPPVHGMLRLDSAVEGKSLAFLVRPYSVENGSVLDHNWISIHSNPPWTETDIPAIVHNRFGKGECIYSAADIECVKSEANEQVILHLVHRLLGNTALSWSATAHPCVRVTVFHDAVRKHFRISLFNRQELTPVITLHDMTILVRPPEGRKFAAVTRIPDGKKIPFANQENGGIRIDVPELETFAMYIARYT